MHKPALYALLLFLTIFLLPGCGKECSDTSPVKFYNESDGTDYAVVIDGNMAGKIVIPYAPFDGEYPSATTALTVGEHSVDYYENATTLANPLCSGSFTLEACATATKTLSCNTPGWFSLPSDYDNQGTITVHSKEIEVCLSDWDVIDGDIIDLVINGNSIATDLEVTATDQCYNISGLSEGDNWIGIVAIDQGDVGAASPRIKISDGMSTQEFEISAFINQPGGYIIKVVL